MEDNSGTPRRRQLGLSRLGSKVRIYERKIVVVNRLKKIGDNIQSQMDSPDIDQSRKVILPIKALKNELKLQKAQSAKDKAYKSLTDAVANDLKILVDRKIK